MFGYVVPDKPNMFVKDFTLYRAYYCGLCKSIGKKCGQCMRFSTNYDTTFLNILLHGVMNVEVEVKRQNCILAPLKRKPIVCNDSLSETVVDANTLLGYYKIQDDIIDSKSLPKKIAKIALVERKYKKARVNQPEVDRIIDEGYVKLRALEGENCASLDRTSHCFGQLLKDVTKTLSKDKYTDALGNMLYFIGKWIYVMDALDDVEEDFKKKQYNPFLSDYKYTDYETFLKDKGEDAKFFLMTAYAKIKENFANVPLEKNEGIITNIVWYGLLGRTNEILGRTCKCKKTRFQF